MRDCVGFSVPTFMNLPDETLIKIADVLNEVSFFCNCYLVLIRLAFQPVYFLPECWTRSIFFLPKLTRCETRGRTWLAANLRMCCASNRIGSALKLMCYSVSANVLWMGPPLEWPPSPIGGRRGEPRRRIDYVSYLILISRSSRCRLPRAIRASSPLFFFLHFLADFFRSISPRRYSTLAFQSLKFIYGPTGNRRILCWSFHLALRSLEFFFGSKSLSFDSSQRASPLVSRFTRPRLVLPSILFRNVQSYAFFLFTSGSKSIVSWLHFCNIDACRFQTNSLYSFGFFLLWSLLRDKCCFWKLEILCFSIHVIGNQVLQN